MRRGVLLRLADCQGKEPGRFGSATLRLSPSWFCDRSCAMAFDSAGAGRPVVALSSGGFCRRGVFCLRFLAVALRSTRSVASSSVSGWLACRAAIDGRECFARAAAFFVLSSRVEWVLQSRV